MYKKISHNMVEEHFNHPSILPSKVMAAAIVAPITGELPAVVINEATLTFRMDSRTLWTRFALGMINLSVVTIGDIPGSVHQVEASLMRSANDIGTYFIPYYGATAGYKIGSLLSAYARIGVEEINAVKTGKGLDQFRTLWVSPINDIAQYFNDLNPSQYPKELLIDQFSNLTRGWTENFQARMKADDISNATSLDTIIKVAVNGIPNHTTRGYVSIADTLSRGVIAQFPLSFVIG
jgi:hypothetical protein